VRAAPDRAGLVGGGVAGDEGEQATVREMRRGIFGFGATTSLQSTLVPLSTVVPQRIILPPHASIWPLHEFSVHKPLGVDPPGFVDPPPVRAGAAVGVRVGPLGIEGRIVQRRGARVGIGAEVGRVVDQADPGGAVFLSSGEFERKERDCATSSPTDQTGFAESGDAFGTLDPASFNRFRVGHSPCRFRALLGALEHHFFWSGLRKGAAFADSVSIS
jgi:hypothetical protein